MGRVKTGKGSRRAKGQTLYPKLVKTAAKMTIEVSEIDAAAIEELANNRVMIRAS